LNSEQGITWAGTITKTYGVTVFISLQAQRENGIRKTRRRRRRVRSLSDEPLERIHYHELSLENRAEFAIAKIFRHNDRNWSKKQSSNCENHRRNQDMHQKLHKTNVTFYSLESTLEEKRLRLWIRIRNIIILCNYQHLEQVNGDQSPVLINLNVRISEETTSNLVNADTSKLDKNYNSRKDSKKNLEKSLAMVSRHPNTMKTLS